MNILQLSPILHLNKRCQNDSTSLNKRCLNPVYTNLKPLNSDTVTFGNKLIQHAFKQDYSAQLPAFKEKGRKLMAILEETCLDVKGATFDRKYCEKAVNKSIERYMEKLKDSCSIPMDRIRSTVFIKDLYDFSIITNFIKALEKKGYYIMPVPDKTSGKKVLSWKYDFDIRLNDADETLISPEEIKKLPAHLREYISKKQKSGYGDIQVRVVDASELPKEQRTLKNLSNLVPQEIIFLFGKATSDAKSDESKYVYNITRKLSKMHILSNNFSDYNILKIKKNIQGIGSILRSNISKPLYRNAEALDLYPNKSHVLEDVQLEEDQCKILKNYMKELQTLTTKAYSKCKKLISSSDYDVEIEKRIKTTSEYKARANKRVSDDEINSKRQELLSELKENLSEDMEAIANQIKNLDETIKKYGIKNSDLKLTLNEKLKKLDQKLEEILLGKTTMSEDEVAKMQEIQVQKNKIKKQLEKFES